jgi:hypothetical protein
MCLPRRQGPITGPDRKQGGDLDYGRPRNRRAHKRSTLIRARSDFVPIIIGNSDSLAHGPGQTTACFGYIGADSGRLLPRASEPQAI